MKKTTLLFFAGCLLLFSFSCKKEREKIDLYSPPTINKLTCKINGKYWLATKIQGGLSISDGYFRLFATRDREAIEIFFIAPYSQLQRKFNQNTLSWYRTLYPKDYGFFEWSDAYGHTENYMTNSIDTGYCTITYMDSISRDVKGIFAFKARDEYTNKTVTVANGYFECVQ
jgi:hypothetical protein